MNHYETMRYQSVCDCTEWPLLPADRANEEIARLQSIVDSLKWANELKDELIHEAASTIAELRRQLAHWKNGNYLPKISDLAGRYLEFTGDMSSEDYVRKMRGE